MAGTSIVMTVAGLPGAERVLGELEDRAEDLSPLMDVIGASLESSTLQRFEDETDPDGVKWKPSQRAAASGGKTLTHSARLKQSITCKASADQVEVGTNVIYARPHQVGGGRIAEHKRTMTQAFGNLLKSPIEVIVPEHDSGLPKRSFLGISAEDQEEIPALVSDYLLGGLAA